ncbi:MAG: hypothetical protein IJU58_01245 [Clostridia bacterium]|nr:hypothetical protein [Clostridia bacterium]
MAKQQVSKDGEKVIVKKKGGCGTFFAGFFCAIIFLVLLVGGGGAYVYFCVNVQQIESLLGIQLPIEGDVNKKTVKDLVALGLDLKNSYVHMKIGELETKVGIKLPEKVPGTDIDISYLYAQDTIITFKGRTTAIRDIEVMEAINNMNQLVDSVVDVLYDHVTVGQILSTANMQTTIEDMGYPAFVDPIYTIGSTKKKLSDLTITQAKNVLTDYYGADNLTIAKLVEAAGLSVIPDDAMYDGLRALKVQTVTTDDLLNNITGQILNNLLDLSDFDFTQTDEFNATNLNHMIDYLEGLYLGDFITLGNAMGDDFFTSHPQFSTLRDTYISKLDEAILNLKVNQILTSTQLARTTLSSSQQNMTVLELIDSTHQPLLTLFGNQNIEELGGYLKELQTAATTTAFTNGYNDLTWAKKLGIEGSSTALLDISSLTINEIMTSDDIPTAIFEKLGTLGNLIGTTDNSILNLIANVELKDLLTNGGDAITHALEYDADDNLVTLATLLNITDTNGINGIISGITVKALLDTPNAAITDALESSEMTLGDLLNMSDTSGINGIISTIKVKELFTDADTIVKTKLAASTQTLGQLLGVDTTAETMSNYILRNLTVGDLFGSDPSASISSVVNGMSLSLILPQPTTGILSLVTNYNTLTVGTLDEINVNVADTTIEVLNQKGIITDAMLTSKGIVKSGSAWDYLKTKSMLDIIEIVYNNAP